MADRIVRGTASRFALGSMALLAGLAANPAAAAPSPGPADADDASGQALITGNGFSLLAPAGAPPRQPAEERLQVAQAEPEAKPETVGQPPEDEEERFLAQLGGLSVGGVLTPAGMLVVEPSLTYSHTGANRFTFRGTEIVETVLVGVVEAEDADRDFYEAALGLRYGVTDRLEIETRVPYVYRDDSVRTTANIGGTDVTVENSINGDGIGDVEFAGHYQINQGGGGIPYFVGNLRGKLANGRGPFDVDRDAAGIETELPTGSGFYSVEPSLTVIYPTDPMVLFASFGYLWNIQRDVNEQIGGSEIGKVDPGDSFRFGVGFSFSVNETTSFSISYSQDNIQETETEVDGTKIKGEDLTVGQISLGLSHRINDWLSVDLGTTFGVTSDATDVTLGLRFPMRFQLFDY